MNGGDSKTGVPVFALRAFAASDSPAPAGHVDLEGIDDPGAHVVIQLKGDLLSELTGTDGALLMRRPAPDDPWPRNGAVVLVRHPDLQHGEDGEDGPGVGIGELRASRRYDVKGNFVAVKVILRPRTRQPGRRPLRLTLSPPEWERLRPTAVCVRVMTEEERQAWSD